MPREHDLLENVFLNPNTAKSIDQYIQKVLHDLDNPEPPLELSDVRELLRLDRAYYSSTDHGVLDEVIHRLKVAGKQIIRRPTILMDVIKFQILSGFCFRKGGPIGAEEVLIKNTNNNDHIFLIECFYNHYDALTLGVFQRVHNVSVSVGSD